MTAQQLMSVGFRAVLYDEDISDDDPIASYAPEITEGHLTQGFVSFGASATTVMTRINLIRQ